MSGIQVSGLIANSAFDWKSVVDQLIAADSQPITKLNTDKTANSDKSTALAAVQTSLQDLQDSLQSIRTGDIFSSRNVSTDTASSTWKSSSVTGAAIGSYKIAVSQLATAAQLRGVSNIGSSLASSSDVSNLTIANLRTSTAVTAGTFTVDGHQITVALTDSLQDVFDNIAAATGDVTASYDSDADGITLTRASGELVVGAGNDTSNFLSVFKVANNGTSTASSSAGLGTTKLTAPLASSGLAAITAVNGSGVGSFAINGVTISYNVNSDNLGAVLNRINSSTAGVVAAYDSANDRVLITNKTTGDTGIAVSEATGGLLGAIGITTAGGGTLVHGKNALFKVNNGQTLTSASNTLDASVHGITGLSVTVNSETTQTLQVESDTATMQSAIQSFIDKFNATQDLIETDTKITVSSTGAKTSILSDNREVQDWGRKLQSLAFEAVGGLNGTVTRLDNLGIDFNSTSGHLTIKDSGKLATALGDHPDDVQSFFLKSSTGFVPKLFGYLTNVISADGAQQSRLTKANSDIDNQIKTLQSRLDSEREQLTNSFIAMLDAQSSAKNQQSYLTSAFFNNNSNNNGCWVARAVYGAENPLWIVFRHWLLHRAPSWFRALYLRHGERFALWLGDKPWLRSVIRRWMDGRIAALAPKLSSR
jgi:flagellar hook-associated protein 2